MYHTQPGFHDMFHNIAQHGVGLIFILIDLCIISFPFRLLHFIYSFSLGILYLIYTVFNWAAGYPNIYYIIDWGNKLNMTLGYSLGLIFIGFPSCHVFVFFLSKVIRLCQEKCSRRNSRVYSIEHSVVV